VVDQPITFQRTRAWKETNDPDRDAGLTQSQLIVVEHRSGRVDPCSFHGGEGIKDKCARK
jgi:hypothetical protein